jgi:hypothetical protein
LEPLQAACAPEQSHLIEALIFLLLLLDVKPHCSFIPSDRGYPVSPRPKMLPNKIPSFAPMRSRNVDRTLALQIPCFANSNPNIPKKFACLLHPNLAGSLTAPVNRYEN